MLNLLLVIALCQNLLHFNIAEAIYVPGDEVTKPPKRQEPLQWPSISKNRSQKPIVSERLSEVLTPPEVGETPTFQDPSKGISRNAETLEIFPSYRQHESRIHSYSYSAPRSSSANSGAVCPLKETGQFPYVADCRKFINCWKGRGFIQACAPGTLFNPVSLECDYPSKVKCLTLDDDEEPDYVGTGMIDTRIGNKNNVGEPVFENTSFPPKINSSHPPNYPSRTAHDNEQPSYSPNPQLSGGSNPSPWMQPPPVSQYKPSLVTNNPTTLSHNNQPNRPTENQPLSPWLHPPRNGKDTFASHSPSPSYPSPWMQPPPTPQYSPLYQQYPAVQTGYQSSTSSQQYAPRSLQNPLSSQHYPRPYEPYLTSSNLYPAYSQEHSQQPPQLSKQFPQYSQQLPQRPLPFPQSLPPSPHQRSPPLQQNIPPSQHYPKPPSQPAIPEITTPVTISKHKADCSMPGGSGLAPHPTECSKFLNCWKGKAHTQTCAAGTLFNVDTLQCDHPYNVVCYKEQANYGSSQDSAPGKKWPSSSHQSIQQTSTLPPHTTLYSYVPQSSDLPDRSISYVNPFSRPSGPIPSHTHGSHPSSPYGTSQTLPPAYHSSPSASSTFPSSPTNNYLDSRLSRPPPPHTYGSYPSFPSSSSEAPLPINNSYPSYTSPASKLPSSSTFRSNTNFSSTSPPTNHLYPYIPSSSQTPQPPPTTYHPHWSYVSPPQRLTPRIASESKVAPPAPYSTNTVAEDLGVIPEASEIVTYYDEGTKQWQTVVDSSKWNPSLGYHPVPTLTSKPSTTTTSKSTTPTPPLLTTTKLSKAVKVTPTLPSATSQTVSYIMSLVPRSNSTLKSQSNGTKPAVGYSPGQMTSGQEYRLRGGPGPNEGYVEVQGSSPGWGLVCDVANGWTIVEATVICRQLGYVRGAELSWQGRPVRPIDDTIRVSISEVKCTGNEASLSSCRLSRGAGQCLIARDAAGVRCYRNHASICQPGEVNHDGKCYSLVVPSEDTAQEAFTHGEALADCQKRKGKLLDINSQAENDFISEWLLQLYPHINSVITSGIGVPVMGNSIWIWEGSGEAFTFHKWWPGWTGTNSPNKTAGVGERMQCVVAKRVFPCMAPYLPDVAGVANMCEANYFYWDTEDCSLTHDHPYICERPNDDVGCVQSASQDYTGVANVTTTGTGCITWDSPLVPTTLKYRVTDRIRAATLTGHNYCRNVGGGDSQPWCYIGEKGQFEYCDIPSCVNTGVEKAIASSSLKCSSKEFECQPNECILLTWVCDGTPDCSNGRDEKDCSGFLKQFKKHPNKHLVKHDVEKWLRTNANTCARRCKEAKGITCRSFSHHAKDEVCLLSDSNIGLSGQLDNNESWNYYELEIYSVECQDMFQCDNGKCLNKTKVCDGKNNCGDRSDENGCSVKYLDYDIRLSGNDDYHQGRVEVKVFGQWGFICDDLFGLRDAEVVCKELGFTLGAAEVISHTSNGTSPVYLIDDLQCLGNETTIRECEFEGWGVHDCGPEEIVGVVCRVPGLDCAENYWRCDTSKECIPIGFLCDNLFDCDDGSDEIAEHCEAPVELRLVGGPNNMSGRVEVRYHSVWGTVCDDDFSANTAQVICRSLGFDGPAEAKKDAAYGPGEGQIWLDQVHCMGKETKIEDCLHSQWGESNCAHEEDASVVCSLGDPPKRRHGHKPKAVASPAINSLGTSAKEILPSQCGLQTQEYLDQMSRVLGGTQVVEGSFPWQASVRVRTIPSGKSVHWCGAVVISPLHILTAGHCLVDYKKGAYFIRVGDFDTEVDDSTEQEANIEEIYVHEGFNKGMRLNNDIALVKLKSGGLRLSPTVQPVCLPSVTARYNPGLNCTISGWGSVKAGGAGYSRKLRAAWVPILPADTCNATFVYGPSAISEGMVCAGYLEGGSDSCQGDSGGPLICLNNGRHTLYGITSWGHGCGRTNKPGVYSKVGFYRQWIDKKLEDSMSGR